MNESNDMIKKTCGFAKNLLKKTQEMLEISHINFKILQLKGRIERKYVKIGYFIYNNQKSIGLERLTYESQTDRLKNICCEIDELYDSIKKLKKELNEIKKYDYCEDCKQKEFTEHKDNKSYDSKSLTNL